MILRATAKLAKKLKTTPLLGAELKFSAFEEWYGHLFNAGRYQLILLTNAYALYSVIFPAKGVNSIESFTFAAAENLKAIMQLQGIGDMSNRFISKSNPHVEIYKTADKAVIGSMNDMISLTKFFLANYEISLSEISIRLNATPFSLIKYNHPFNELRNMPLT